MSTYFPRYYFVSVYVSQRHTNTLKFIFCSLFICRICQITAWVAFVFKNILIMVGTQMSSDYENKCLSLQHSHSNNCILHHPCTPSDTHKNTIFMLPGAFLGVDVDGGAALRGWQLCTSVLLCTDPGGAVRREMKGSLCVRGMNSRTKCVHRNMYIYKPGMPHCCAPFWRKALHRTSKQPYFCIWLVKSSKKECYLRMLSFYLAVYNAEK